jgi:CBS domain-containing protein
MRIKDLMSSDVEVIRPGATVAEAAELMKALDIGILPICDGGRLIGILTDRDIVVRGTADGFHPETMSAREVMTSKVIYCFEDQEVAEAGRIMKEKQIRRLPVLNREKQLVGIISLGDLAGGGGDKTLAGETLQDISEPGGPKQQAR